VSSLFAVHREQFRVGLLCGQHVGLVNAQNAEDRIDLRFTSIGNNNGIVIAVGLSEAFFLGLGHRLHAVRRDEDCGVSGRAVIGCLVREDLRDLLH
jgi:hypothetical protein